MQLLYEHYNKTKSLRNVYLSLVSIINSLPFYFNFPWNSIFKNILKTVLRLLSSFLSINTILFDPSSHKYLLIVEKPLFKPQSIL